MSIKYNEDISPVKGVQFFILGPEHVKKMSVCEIKTPFGTNTSLEGTLSDPRLGTTDNRKKCVTCENEYKNCSGHNGHIKLKRPMFNIIYMKSLARLLNCICYHCCSPIIKPSIMNEEYSEILQMNKKYSNKSKFSQIVKLSSKSSLNLCNFCNAPVLKFTYDKKASYSEISCKPKKTKNNSSTIETPTKMSPFAVLKILSRISDEDCSLLGFNPEISRPENMILTYLLVSPPSVRPSVKTDSGKVSDDDLTHKYNDIIKFNNNISDLDSSDFTKDEYSNSNIKCLQYHVITLMDNSALKEKAVHKNGGRPLKSYRDRVGGKEGRFRGTLMGKRVNGSGRSVITPDPTLSIDEVGIPIEICSNITYPEIVNRYNIGYLTTMVRNGSKYPGAKSIESNGKTINLSLANLKTKLGDIKLKYGDVVLRHMIEGDYVLFNRQPSLHKMSIMAHKCKVNKRSKTLCSNPNVTKPYNADYDGDEMNIHVPQSIPAICELMLLASVQYQIVSPQASKPVIKPVQDTVLGITLFSEYSKDITEDEYLVLIKDLYTFNSEYVNDDLKRGQGKDKVTNSTSIVSGIIPPVNYNDGKFIVENGKITKGSFTKNSLSDNEGGLIHIIFNDCGSKYAMDFINNIGTLAHNFLNGFGFSCGYSDTILPQNIKDNIKTIIHDGLYVNDNDLESISYIIQKVKEGDSKFAHLQDKEMFITTTKKKLSAIKSKVEKEAITYFKNENKNKINGMYTMVVTGSKGKNDNISQITGLLGLQEVNDTWIENQLYRRTLPHFARDDISPQAHGFVENSFYSGLNPTEYYYHAGSGREGVINKTITTSDTGYIQRKFMKMLEDLHCCEDGTIRNANNVIIQMCYANDGFDTTYHELQNVHFINYSKSHLFMEYGYDDRDITIAKNIYNSLDIPEDEFSRDELQNEFDYIYDICHEVKQSRFMGVNNLKAYSAINIERIINTFVSRYKLGPNCTTDLTPVKIYRNVHGLLDILRVCKNKDVNKDATIIIRLLIAVNLSSRNLLRLRFNEAILDELIKYIYSKFVFCILNPGENVGSVSAQSLGQPTTQLSLNAFHNIGFDADGPAGGVGRLRECMGLSQSLKNPMMKIVLNDGLSDNIRGTIMNSIKEVKFKQIVKKYERKFKAGNIFLNIYFNKNNIESHNITWSNMVDLYNTISNQSDSFCILKANNITYIDTNGNEVDEIVDGSFPPIGIRYKLNNNIDQHDSSYEDLMNLTIKGIKNITGVKQVIVKKESFIDGEYISPNDPLYKKQENHKHEMVTIGSNMGVVSVLMGIDIYNSYSNNIWEMYSLFGVEVARKCIIKEVSQILGADLNPIHATLLADAMTNEGILVSIDRHGQNKTESGPLGRATFEETIIQLTNACMYNDKDNMEGVSANVMFGQFIKSGTNFSNIVYDVEKLQSLNPVKFDDKETIIENTDKVFDMNLIKFRYVFY